MSETDFARALLVACSKIPGVRLWRQNAGKALFRGENGKVQSIVGAPEGAADLTGIYGENKLGLRIEVETKRPGKKQRPNQIQWQAFIERNGGLYLLATAEKGKSHRENAEFWAGVLADRLKGLLRERGR